MFWQAIKYWLEDIGDWWSDLPKIAKVGIIMGVAFGVLAVLS